MSGSLEAGVSSCGSGIAAKNVVPSASSLETHTAPWCARAARFAMESPMPVPAARVDDVDVRWRGYTGEFSDFRIVE